jgi:hypothetical protein
MTPSSTASSSTSSHWSCCASLPGQRQDRVKSRSPIAWKCREARRALPGRHMRNSSAQPEPTYDLVIRRRAVTVLLRNGCFVYPTDSGERRDRRLHVDFREPLPQLREQVVTSGKRGIAIVWQAPYRGSAPGYRGRLPSGKPVVPDGLTRSRWTPSSKRLRPGFGRYRLGRSRSPPRKCRGPRRQSGPVRERLGDQPGPALPRCPLRNGVGRTVVPAGHDCHCARRITHGTVHPLHDVLTRPEGPCLDDCRVSGVFECGSNPLCPRAIDSDVADKKTTLTTTPAIQLPSTRYHVSQQFAGGWVARQSLRALIS